MAFRDDIDIPLVVSLGAATAAAVTVAVVATEAVFYRVEYRTLQSRFDNAEAQGTYAQNSWKPQVEAINKPGPLWLDDRQDFAQVSIEQAIKVLAAREGKMPGVWPVPKAE
jgi:hypothetical protein